MSGYGETNHHVEKCFSEQSIEGVTVMRYVFTYCKYGGASLHDVRHVVVWTDKLRDFWIRQGFIPETCWVTTTWLNAAHQTIFSVARNSDSEILTALQSRNCTSYSKTTG